MAVGVYQSDAVAFARYAAAQVMFHRRVIALHQMDETQCCRHCGRVYPCDTTRYSKSMAEHFAQFAADEPPVPAGPVARPYVKQST